MVASRRPAIGKYKVQNAKANARRLMKIDE
jgi:hypothetical protein